MATNDSNYYTFNSYHPKPNRGFVKLWSILRYKRIVSCLKASSYRHVNTKNIKASFSVRGHKCASSAQTTETFNISSVNQIPTGLQNDVIFFSLLKTKKEYFSSMKQLIVFLKKKKKKKKEKPL